MWLEKLWYKAIMAVSGLAALGFGIVGAVIALEQAGGWLKNAVWEPYSIGAALHDLGIPVPYTYRMLGVQKIVDGVLSWPALLGYAALVILFLFVWVRASESLNKIGRKEMVRKQAADYDFR